MTYPPSHDPIDGAGAYKYGGRWNSKGTYVVYTASTLALARCEMARHANLDSLPEGMMVYEIEIPDEHCLDIQTLPEDWRADPESSSTQLVGDRLMQNPDVLSIKVPSVCDTKSVNYVLNVSSRYFSLVKIIKQYAFEA
jgi:RES domain-containing protein